MSQLAKEIGLLTFSQLATLTLAGFFFKAFLKQQLKKNIEDYKNELQKELEIHKSELKRREEQVGTKFSRLHAERAELLKRIYASLVHLDRAAFVSAYDPLAKEHSTSARVPSDLMVKLDAVEEDFAVSKLLLPPSLCERIQTFLNDLWQHGIESRVGVDLPLSEIDRKQRIYENLKRNHKEKLRPLLTEIENEFRKILE
jgi:uncharacterized membrane-anchored protein YhcB (DUF1043 family)